MARDTGAVLATRNARLLIAPYDPTNALPENTVEFGGEWGSNFDDAGYTNGNIGTTISVDRGTINVDQLLWAVMRPITGGSVRIDTNLAQFTPENLMRASGVGQLGEPVAPGADTRGHIEYTIGAEFVEHEYSVGYEVMKRDGEALRMLIPRSQAVSSPAPRVGAADANAQIAFEVEALPPDTPGAHEIAYIRSIIPATGGA